MYGSICRALMESLRNLRTSIEYLSFTIICTNKAVFPFSALVGVPVS